MARLYLVLVLPVNLHLRVPLAGFHSPDYPCHGQQRQNKKPESRKEKKPIFIAVIAQPDIPFASGQERSDPPKIPFHESAILAINLNIPARIIVNRRIEIDRVIGLVEQ